MSTQLDSTPNRVGVLEAIGAGKGPLSAQEVFTAATRATGLNRVTVYRILDLLVEKGLVERISGDAPPDYFVGPSWCLDKPATLRALQHELQSRNSWQGKSYSRTCSK